MQPMITKCTTTNEKTKILSSMPLLPLFLHCSREKKKKRKRESKLVRFCYEKFALKIFFYKNNSIIHFICFGNLVLKMKRGRESKLVRFCYGKFVLKILFYKTNSIIHFICLGNLVSKNSFKKTSHMFLKA